MDVVTKSVEATLQPVESEHPNGEFEIVLSTEDLDRDGENLWIDEWKQPLPKRIQIDGDHSRSIEKTVGSVVPRIEGNQVVGKGPFASTPYAQTIRQIVTDKDAEGHGICASVTYSETKTKDGKIQRELLNAALVAVPANPNAVFMSAKSVEDKAEGGFSASGDNPQVKHDDMVQAIHDAACHLGAQCLNDVEADPGTADGANKSWQVFRTDDGQKSYRLLGQPNQIYTADEVLAEIGIGIGLKSSSREAGSPQESAEESAGTAAAEKSAVAVPAEESADDTAAQKAKEAEKARGLAFLISMSMKDQ